MNNSSIYRRRFIAGGVALFGATIGGVGAARDSASRLVVRGGGGRVKRYEFVVDGSVDESVSTGGSAQQEVSTTSVNGESVSRVRGAIAGGNAEYAVDGNVTLFGADEGVTAFVNGKRATPADLGGGSRHLVVDAGDSGGVAYRIETTGDVVPTGRTGDAPVETARIDPDAEVSDGSARGVADGVADAYLFTGDLSALDVDGGTTAYLDGEEVDPASFGGGGAGGDEGGTEDVDGEAADEDGGAHPADPSNLAFVDCTTVEVVGSYDEVLLEVLTIEVDDALGTVYNEEEYVYGLDDGEEISGTTRIELPPGYFTERQIVEAAVATGEGGDSRAANPHAATCRMRHESDD
ncbi:hypothetical protein [Halegenticoccus tardaugens]|uniref:hypothetical protein n=1 Tax=Halegenticoccus tardaugens TaxID=2071624 RepID=UPI00100B56D6|nr:hypothetical protein [Halegenticoccus tardaugens]